MVRIFEVCLRLWSSIPKKDAPAFTESNNSIANGHYRNLASAQLQILIRWFWLVAILLFTRLFCFSETRSQCEQFLEVTFSSLSNVCCIYDLIGLSAFLATSHLKMSRSNQSTSKRIPLYTSWITWILDLLAALYTCTHRSRHWFVQCHGKLIGAQLKDRQECVSKVSTCPPSLQVVQVFSIFKYNNLARRPPWAAVVDSAKSGSLMGP